MLEMGPGAGIAGQRWVQRDRGGDEVGKAWLEDGMSGIRIKNVC